MFSNKIASILVSSILILTILVAPVYGLSYSDYPVHLEATGTCSGPNCEDRITIELTDKTLGDINSISWQFKLIGGYIPHVDISLDYNGDGTRDDVLVIEGAYVNNNVNNNTWSTGIWLNTFENASGTYVSWCSDCSNPVPTTEVNDNTPAWLNSLGQWPTIYTLGGWKTGIVLSKVNASTPITNIEIEVDNWLRDDLGWGVYAANAESYIRDIRINGVPVVSLPEPEPTKPEIIALTESLPVLPDGWYIYSVEPSAGGNAEFTRLLYPKTGAKHSITTAIYIRDYTMNITNPRYFEWKNLTSSITVIHNSESSKGTVVVAHIEMTNDNNLLGTSYRYWWNIIDSNGTVLAESGTAGGWISLGETIKRKLYTTLSGLEEGEYTIQLFTMVKGLYWLPSDLTSVVTDTFLK